MIIEKTVADPYTEAEFRFGEIYLDRERDDDLDAEGYAREIMRRVQNARKKAGLEKVDRISLFIKVSQELAGWLQKWEKQVAEKVGASQIRISENDPANEHLNKDSFKIKDESVEISFDKV